MWLSCRFMVCCRPPRRSTLFPYTTLFRSQRTGFADTDDTVALCRERLRLPCPYAVCNRGRVELGRYGDLVALLGRDGTRLRGPDGQTTSQLLPYLHPLDLIPGHRCAGAPQRA